MRKDSPNAAQRTAGRKLERRARRRTLCGPLMVSPAPSGPDRSTLLRRLAHAVVAGALFSCLRAPLGLDWTQVVTVASGTSAIFRAAALLALAVSLDPRRRIWSQGLRADWLAAFALGFALHGLWLDATPGSRAGFVLALVLGTLLLRALAGAKASAGALEEPLGRRERVGIVLLGMGALFALEPLCHQVRLFTLATRVDDALVAFVFLALLALGAVSFGPLFARMGGERTRFATGIAASAAAALGGLVFLGALSQDGLHGYLRRLDLVLGGLRTLDAKVGGILGIASIPTLDGASIGTPWVTAILAAGALVGPAFLLGATLGSTRQVSRVAHALFGAALGLILLPHFVQLRGRPLQPSELGQASLAWELLQAGVGLACVGALLVALGGVRRGPALVLVGVVALVPWIRPHLVLLSFSPWAPSPIRPELVWPTSEGLLTIEPGRGGKSIVTLDRKRLTPTAEEEPEDERRLRLAWKLLGPVGTAQPVRGLFIGQLTPARAEVLRSFVSLELDRTATWHRAMSTLDEHLFRGSAPPPGRTVSPAEARLGLKRGNYDWVVVLPIHGPIVTWKAEASQIWGSANGPSMVDLALQGDAVGVVWLQSDALLARGTTLEPLLLSVDHLASFSIALLRGRPRASAPELGPIVRTDLRAAPRPLRFANAMPQQRSFLLGGRLAASLASDEAPDLVRGLALHFEGQQLSSPYETLAQQIELDEEAMRAFFAAVPQPGNLDRLTRDLWEQLAWILTEKRLPEWALVYLEPVADRFAPWPALDLAVGHAYRELLEPEIALGFLDRARTARPDLIEPYVESARCARELEQHADSVHFLETAMALAPGRPDLEREYGLALWYAGDERGRGILERFLSGHPEDEGLRLILEGRSEAGPFERNP